MITVFNINEKVLVGMLKLDEFAKINSLNKKREIETQGKFHLLKFLLKKQVEINYDENGKPHLINDSKHISISHSHDLMVIIINNFESTGIDIELIRDKIIKIKHKFLSKSELENANDDVEKLLVYWAAKESLYKIYGLKEVDFIKNLHIEPFIKNNYGTIIGTISMPHFNKSFELCYSKIGEYMMVYSLKKIEVC